MKKKEIYMYDLLELLDKNFTPGTTKLSDWLRYNAVYDQDTLRDGKEHIDTIENRRIKKSNHLLFIGTNMKLIPEHIGEGLEIRILPERSKRKIGSVVKEFYLDGLHYFYIYNIGKGKITEAFMVPLIIE